MNFSYIFSPDILLGNVANPIKLDYSAAYLAAYLVVAFYLIFNRSSNVSGQSETGLCNLKMSECPKKAHITMGSHNRHI